MELDKEKQRRREQVIKMVENGVSGTAGYILV